MKYTSIVLLVLLLISCKQNGKSNITEINNRDLPSDSLTLKVFKELAIKEYVTKGFKQHSLTDSIYIADTLKDSSPRNNLILRINEDEKILNKKDSLYIVAQRNNHQQIKVKHSFFKQSAISILPQETIEDNYRKPHFQFYKPYLSIDKNTVILQIDYNGSNDGFGVALIFKKQQNIWHLIKEIPIWGS